MYSELNQTFLEMVRLGVGNDSPSRVILNRLPKEIDWSAMKALAEQQRLSAIIVDGVDKLPEELRPPKPMLLQWIGSTLQGYECRYEQYRRTIAEMAGWYNSHGIKMMVLKGLACSLDWPKPEHRPCGDIDIWQFGRQKEADEVLIKEKGIKIDSAHHHHTVFFWRDFMVENHYNFLNVHHHKSNVEIEEILKELGQDDSHFIELFGEKVFLPSPNLHALFLLRHSMSNFASTGLSLRQLLDWAFFVKAHGKEVDWQWLMDVLEKYGMKPLFQIYNAICVEDLGFDSQWFPTIQFKPKVKERVLNDILSREFAEKEKGGFICRAIFKYRRWRSNAWKHELCFKESMWSAFWSGVKSHLIKPSSI